MERTRRAWTQMKELNAEAQRGSKDKTFDANQAEPGPNEGFTAKSAKSAKKDFDAYLAGRREGMRLAGRQTRRARRTYSPTATVVLKAAGWWKGLPWLWELVLQQQTRGLPRAREKSGGAGERFFAKNTGKPGG